MTLLVSAIVLVALVFVPAILVGLYLEWRAKDATRRIRRLEERRRYVTENR